MIKLQDPNRRRSALVVTLVAAAVAISLASCSSSGGSSSNTASKSQEGSATATAAATASGAEAGVTLARAAAAKLLTRPTSIGVTQPVGKSIPAGKKIYFAVPNVPSALAMADPLKQAAAALGWTATVVNAGTAAEDFVNAVQKAVQAKPDGVFIAGIPPAAIQTQLSALRSEKVPVITLGAPLGNIPASSTGIIFNIAGIPYNNAAGVALANWVTADSGGKTAALTIGVPDFPGPLALSSGFKAQMAKVCSGCPVSNLNFPANTLGQSLPQTLAGYLRSHPAIKYVAADFDDMYAGVPAALKAAGITSVKLVGNTPGTPDQVNIAAGNFEAAGYMFALFENPWRVIDVFARYFAGTDIKVSANAPIPEWIISKANVSSWGGKPSEQWPLVADYQEQYKKLWGVG